MNNEGIVREFERLAQRLGIRIRYTVNGPSGLCSLKGEQILFIEKGLDAAQLKAIFINEFKLLDLEGVFVVPVLRRLLELNADQESWE